MPNESSSPLKGGELPFWGTPGAHRQAIIAGIVGNTLEWYDFGVYGFLATALAKQFFPSSSEYVGLLQTFGAFGAGFVARPLGSLLLGRLGDVQGRKAALTITILLMAGGTIAIGIVPTYAQIGIAAPFILVVARLVQGLAAGGEWGNAAAFMAEWARPGQRGVYGGLLLSSVAGGLLLGSGVAALVSSLLSPQELGDWGWRIPFLAGALLLPVGLYIRRNVTDTPVFAASMGRSERLPMGPFLYLLVRATAICLPLLMASYMVTVYMPSYAQLYGRIDRPHALWANTLALALTVIAAPLFGHLSDRLGRKRPMITSAVLLILAPYPLYLWIASLVPFETFLGIQLLLSAIVVSYTGSAPASVAELFPTSARSGGAALANAIAGVLGGFTPFVSTWLIHTTGSLASPGLLIIVSGIAALLATFGMRETAFGELA
jgi:MHS family proline/betaine transporter-like MFS transporter